MSKHPRGWGLDRDKQWQQDWALKLCLEAGIKLSGVADAMFHVKARELASIAKRIRRDINKLEGRIKNIDIRQKAEKEPTQ